MTMTNQKKPRYTFRPLVCFSFLWRQFFEGTRVNILHKFRFFWKPIFKNYLKPIFVHKSVLFAPVFRKSHSLTEILTLNALVFRRSCAKIGDISFSLFQYFVQVFSIFHLMNRSKINKVLGSVKRNLLRIHLMKLKWNGIEIKVIKWLPEYYFSFYIKYLLISSPYNQRIWVQMTKFQIGLA